eukprot:g5839.t1
MRFTTIRFGLGSAVLSAVALGAGWQSANAAPPGFAIQDEADYARFIDAVRASEYVRESILIGGDLLASDCSGQAPASVPPRVIASIALGIAFAERNPLADTGDLSVFLEATDAVLASAIESDPDLSVPEHLLAAVRYHRVLTGVAGDPASEQLAGFDTNVGERALELLGVELPPVFDVDSLADHARAVQSASTTSVITGPELGLLLIRAFMGQAPDATEHIADTGAAIDGFLLCRGVDSSFGLVRPDMEGVNMAVSAMPTFAQYEAALAVPVGPLDPALCDPGNEDLRDCQAPNPLQESLRQAIYSAVDIGGEIISEFGEPATLEESLDLTPLEIQQIEAQRIADLRRSSESRTSMLANAALLFSDTDAAPYAERQLDLGSAAIGANTHWATVKAGIETYAGFASGGLALLQGDAAGFFSSTADGVLGIFDAAEANFSNGVTTDDIYQQAEEIQMQLVEVQTQLNERFDAIDAKLNIVFDTMINAFDVVLGDLENISESVDQQTNLILEQIATLNRLEDTLGIYARDLLAQDFENDVNFYLSARGVEDIPYAQFQAGAASYFSYGANTSTSDPFVGNPDAPFSLIGADGSLAGDTVSTRLAELMANATSFSTLAPYSPDGAAGPEPWSAGATAYTQLAAQSPWYYAALLGAQQATLPVTNTDRLIQRAEHLLGFIDWCRQTGEFGLTDEAGAPVEESHLIAGLIDYYALSAGALQDAIDTHTAFTLSAGPGGSAFDYSLSMPDGSYLNLWNEDPYADPGEYVPPLTRLTTGWGDASDNLSFGANLPAFDGFAIFSPTATGQQTEDQRTLAAMLRTRMLAQTAYNDAAPTLPQVHWYMTRLSGNNQLWAMNIAVSDVPGSAGGTSVARRELRYYYEYYEEGDPFEPDGWYPISYSSVNLASILMKDIWPLGLRDMLASGARINPDETIEFTDQGSGSAVRIRFVADNVILTRNRPQLEDDALEFYQGIRSLVRAEIITQFAAPGSDIEIAARTLNDAEALLDAYTSVAFAGAFDRSEAIRSALRGAPPSPANGYEGSAFGIRADDAFELLFKADEADIDPGEPVAFEDDFASLASTLKGRLESLRPSFAAEARAPRQTSPTIAWTRESLRAMRDDASRLAVDDAYGSYAEGATRSVLDNDTRQLLNTVQDGQGVTLVYRPIEIDLDFAHPDGGGAYRETDLGRVTFNPDGTFSYTPNPGAMGIDVFPYRVICDIATPPSAPTLEFSLPAYVRVAVEAPDCPADLGYNGQTILTTGNTFLNLTNHPGSTPYWSFDFQFTPRADDTVGGRNYLLTLQLDTDPGPGTDFSLNDSTIAAPIFDAGADPLDHSWDDGDGLFLNPGPGAWSDDSIDYVYSQSWRPGFAFYAGAELEPGDYQIRWSAAGENGNTLASVSATARLLPGGQTSVSLDAVDSCLDASETQLVVAIDLANPLAMISGGQFFLDYDETLLDFVSADVADPNFVELFETVNETTGEIDYAVSADFGSSDGTSVSTTLATITFNVLGDFCDEAALVAFRPHSPPTRVTEFGGAEVLPYLADLGVVTNDSVAPSVAAPTDIALNADAGGCDAELVFTDPIDTPVSISATQAPGVWYIDRYAPAAFEQQNYLGDNRLLHSISAADSMANRPASFSSAFYNTQGRKYDVNIPTGQKWSIDLYIPSDWATSVRRADLWATTRDSQDAIAGYPILGYTSDDPNDLGNPGAASPTPRFRVYTQDTDQELGNGATADWVDLGLPVGFSYDRWWTLETELTDTTYVHRLYDDTGTEVLAYVDTITYGAVRTSDLIVQAYNFGESYDVYWDNVSTGPDGALATDDCGNLMLTYERSDDPLLGLSDPFPSGVTTITWTASDECGNTSSDSQTVTVAAVNDLAVAVELSPTVEAGPFDRCITFELIDASNAITPHSEVMTFVGGVASGTIEVPCGDYVCITARDSLHTLRKTDNDHFTVVGTQYVADFTATGDDDRLVGGNLNDDEYIDILDFGVFIGQFGTTPSADTTCATIAPHADISGDGMVTAGDFGFIQINFLDAHEMRCDGSVLPSTFEGFAIGRPGVPRGPVTSISVEELLSRGMGRLATADLNADGLLDQLDVAAFLSGARPAHLADVDSDGVVTVADVSLLASWLDASDPRADVNADDSADFNDLVFVIERFGMRFDF